jgi:aspartyl-tRNA(Asn)/glutamyl-tRNA(Gln) amidotransferase subunit B
MIELIDKEVISGKMAKALLPKIIVTGKSPSKIVEEEGMIKISDRDHLTKVVDKVFSENPKAVEDALIDEKAVHYLIGQLMKTTHGKADPSIAGQMVNDKLNSIRKKKGK